MTFPTALNRMYMHTLFHVVWYYSIILRQFISLHVVCTIFFCAIYIYYLLYFYKELEIHIYNLDKKCLVSSSLRCIR